MFFEFYALCSWEWTRWTRNTSRRRRFRSPIRNRQQSQQSRTIVIQIVWTTNGQPPALKINQENVRWEDLETRLAEIYLKRAEKVAFVRGDADVDFQYVADVIDMAHHAEVEWIGLLTEQPESEGEEALASILPLSATVHDAA